jgi:hypothetical protein
LGDENTNRMVKVLILGIIVSILAVWWGNLRDFLAQILKKGGSKKSTVFRPVHGYMGSSVKGYNLNRVLIDYTKKPKKIIEEVEEDSFAAPSGPEVLTSANMEKQEASKITDASKNETKIDENVKKEEEDDNVMPKGLQFLKKYQEINKKN